MQTATSEAESKSRDLNVCVHHYTLSAPCPEGQGILTPKSKFLKERPPGRLTSVSRLLTIDIEQTRTRSPVAYGIINTMVIGN